MFNAIIENLDLGEIALIGRQYTWANNFEVPKYKNWAVFWLVWSGNKKFTLVTVHALQSGLSDHTPLLVDSGEAARGEQDGLLFRTIVV